MNPESSFNSTDDVFQNLVNLKLVLISSLDTKTHTISTSMSKSIPMKQSLEGHCIYWYTKIPRQYLSIDMTVLECAKGQAYGNGLICFILSDMFSGLAACQLHRGQCCHALCREFTASVLKA